ncbi:hypothetical protein CAL7716_015000 [Calothrix sp. PCC 7716]|nr:hypothetical protein CAL7716_015000 [Calothrix sp. PCC 7716]
MTQLPPHESLLQYYQLRNSLIMLLDELAKLSQQRNLTIIADKYIDGLIPTSYIVGNTDTLHQLTLRAIVDEEIRQAYKPFRIAVVGEFTRGKTTLLNALLEQEVLTSDRRPNTATSTILKYGTIPHIRVRYFDSTGLEPLDISTQNLAADLVGYTSDGGMDEEKYEALLRGDKKSLAEQIEGVHVWVPSEFLKLRGYELIDTPGLGSIFDSHQVITYNAIPQMDAVLFLTQFNALIGEGEQVFLGSLREYVNRFLFVLTKIDLAEKENNPHQAIDKAIDFTRSVLINQVQLNNPTLYPISAIAAVQDNQYHKSGIIQLIEALDKFISDSSGKGRLLKLYCSANTYHLWLEQDIQRELGDLSSKIAQLTEVKEKLVSKLNNIEVSKCDLSLLLKAQTQELEQRLLDGISPLTERKSIFMHNVQLLQNIIKFFLSQIIWDIKSQPMVAPEELPLISLPDVSDITQLNVGNQSESFFRDWVKSLYLSLEASINRVVKHYEQMISQEILLINEQHDKLQQRLHIINQHNHNIKNIHQQLESIISYINITPEI